MPTLHLTLPSRRRCAADPSLAGGTLMRWLALGDCLADLPGGREAALRELFRFDGAVLPVAALTREHDARDAGDGLWLRADPAYVRADMAAARMLGCGEIGLSSSDAAELVRCLQPVFDAEGFRLDAPSPARWHLRCPPGTALPVFASPDQVLGDDLYLHMPAGEVGRRWRRLLSEVQIELHNHPLNEQRAARGQVPVNALWFWGGGALPAKVDSLLAQVITDDVLAQALAARAGVATEALPQRQAELPAAVFGTADAWLDLAGLRASAALEADWLAPLDAALRQGAIRAVRLRFESGEGVDIRAAHRWRFWRRLVPLAVASDNEEIAALVADHGPARDVR